MNKILDELVVLGGSKHITRSPRMNIAPDLNNHLRSIDLFRSMIIKKNRSKVRDSHWIVIGKSLDSHRIVIG